MSNDAKKTSQLGIATTLSANDRVVVLTNPASSAQTQTISISNIIGNSSSIRANTSSYGVVKIGSGLTVNAAGFLNANAAGADFTSLPFNVIPATDNTYSLGNSSHQWKSLYVTSNTIYIGGTPVTVDTGGNFLVNGSVIGVETYLTPNIAYTGVFLGYPGTIPVTKSGAVFYTSNGHVLDTPNKYWLQKRFETADYDLSGLETLQFDNIGGITDYFRIGGKSEALLTTIDFKDMVAIGDHFYIRDLPSLETVNANNIVYIGDYLEINNMDNANTQFNFPNLETIVGTFYYTWNDTLENTPQFPALKTINNNMYIYYNSALQNTMVFDSLEYTGYISIYNNDGMITGPEFPSLVSCEYFDMNNNNYMTMPPLLPSLESVYSNFYFYGNDLVMFAIALPSLVSCGYIGWYDNTSMVGGFDFSSLKQVSGDVNISNCDLNEEAVDYILTTLASLDGTNGTTSYDNRNVYLNNGTNAIPSAAGLAAKATLEARGCSVSVNS